MATSMSKKCKNYDVCENFVGSNSRHLECSQCSTIRKRYGITLEERNELYHEQAGRCANSGCNEPVKFFNTADKDRPVGVSRAVVDHCHDSGDVRGILCHNCNVSLGLLNDDIGRLLGLVKYLS